MPVLISFEKEDGLKGHCDERCYNAKGPDCSCICCGQNHGKGYESAVANTNANFSAMVDAFETKNGLLESVKKRI